MLTALLVLYVSVVGGAGFIEWSGGRRPSLLWLLNFALLQWTGLRLGRYREPRADVVLEHPGDEVGLEWDHDAGHFATTTRPREYVHAGWLLYLGVVPLTGWWSRYVRTPWVRRLS